MPCFKGSSWFSDIPFFRSYKGALIAHNHHTAAIPLQAVMENSQPWQLPLQKAFMLESG